MIDQETLKRLSPEQRKRISLLGVQARELKRMALDPPEYPPIQQGLQLVNIVLDFRFGDARANHVFLFDAGMKNRYEYIMNNKKHGGLIGWHDASRLVASRVRPLIIS